MGEDKLTASIIVCTKDRPDDLGRCLGSIARQARRPEEVIVVDAGAPPAQAVIADFHASLGPGTLRHIVHAPGLTQQRNAGIRSARGQVVHFLDDDVVLDPEYVLHMQRVFEGAQGADVVAASPMIRVPDPLSRLSWAVRRFFLLPTIRGRGRLRRSGFGDYPWNNTENAPRNIAVLAGCACAFRRDVFDRLAFDESLAGYGFMEDLDMAVRAGQLGRIVLEPRARVEHLESPSSRPNTRELAAMQIVNHYRFARAHLPHDLTHTACFWWADLGDTLLKLIQVVKRGDLELARGILDGHRKILNRKNK